MTPNHVRTQVAAAVRNAVRAGQRHRRREDCSALQATCNDFASALVDPAVELLVEQATEEAVGHACLRWASGADTSQPLHGSPLWHVYAAGAMCALDLVAELLQVSRPDPVHIDNPLSDDLAEIVWAEICIMMEAAGVPPRVPFSEPVDD